MNSETSSHGSSSSFCVQAQSKIMNIAKAKKWSSSRVSFGDLIFRRLLVIPQKSSGLMGTKKTPFRESWSAALVNNQLAVFNRTLFRFCTFPVQYLNFEYIILTILFRMLNISTTPFWKVSNIVQVFRYASAVIWKTNIISLRSLRLDVPNCFLKSNGVFSFYSNMKSESLQLHLNFSCFWHVLLCEAQFATFSFLFS